MDSSNYAGFRPMLAYNKPFPWEAARYPLLASPKLDGVRAIVLNGKVMSRTLKPIPNQHVQRMFSHLEGFDGELIVGPCTAPNVYNVTESAVMTTGGEPDVAFYAFDFLMNKEFTAYNRIAQLAYYISHLGPQCRVEKVPQYECANREELEKWEQQFLDWGFEGAITRDPNAVYKYGRGAKGDQCLMKLKRFTDSEARIVGYYEEMANNNVATTDERGYTKRSSHQANKSGKGTLGGIEVVDLENKWRFSIGSGFDAAQKAELWALGDQLIGQIVKYKYFAHGMKDVPRHPIFLGFRRDL